MHLFISATIQRYMHINIGSLAGHLWSHSVKVIEKKCPITNALDRSEDDILFLWKKGKIRTSKMTKDNSDADKHRPLTQRAGKQTKNVFKSMRIIFFLHNAVFGKWKELLDVCSSGRSILLSVMLPRIWRLGRRRKLIFSSRESSTPAIHLFSIPA